VVADGVASPHVSPLRRRFCNDRAFWACNRELGVDVLVNKCREALRKLGKSQLSMEPFDRNVTFASVDLSLMAQH